MPEKNPITPRRIDNFGTRPNRNTLGMMDEEYALYQKRIINEYIENEHLTIRGLSRREKAKEIPLHADRLRRWLVKAGVEVRPAEIAKRKGMEGTEVKSINLRKDQVALLDQFDNRSEIVQMAVDVVLGVPTRNAVLFFEPHKNVIFYDKGDRVEAFITADLTNTELSVVRSLVNKANLHGTGYIARFAVENELTFYGANAEDTNSETV